jgi:hypothetical protein
MKDTWATKLAILAVVIIAFIDGILVAERFYKDSPTTVANEAELLEDVFDDIYEETSEDSLVPLEEMTVEVIEVRSVPFTTQAPLGEWSSAPWNGFAEEASMLMAMQWVRGESTITPTQAVESLRAVGEWERALFGTNGDTSLLQVLQTFEGYYGHDAVYLSTNLEMIEEALDNGKLVLAPINGQILDSPYYGDPAPEHHMILITSYEDDVFIAHDPGTSQGRNIAYDKQKILESIQDLDGSASVLVIEL